MDDFERYAFNIRVEAGLACNYCMKDGHSSEQHWKPSFAWMPTPLEGGGWTWLRRIQRMFMFTCDNDCDHYVYRLPPRPKANSGAAK